MTTPPAPHRVVIVGGGFAGLNAAKKLGNVAGIDVTLVDKRNFHLFQPLLYQVATGALAPCEIASPLRYVLKRYKNVRVLMGEVTGVDAEAQQLLLAESEPLPFDSLILATGSNHHYFGKDHWSETAPGLKTLEDALCMRRKIFKAFEQAETTSDEAARKALLTFVIVGAGPTGVELAGSIADLVNQVMCNEFRTICPNEARIIIAEGTDRVLPVFSKNLSASAKQALESLNVTIHTNTFVTDISDAHATLKTPEGELNVPTHTILWGAGVMGNKLGKLVAEPLGAELDRMGRLMVSPTLSLPNHDSIYVVGDLAHYAHTKDGTPLPGVAPVALQQGLHVAKVILQKRKGQTPLPFQYFDKGSMAIIGNNKAVARSFLGETDGFMAWVMWLVVHVAFLVEFDNRLAVVFDWFVSYVYKKRASRLIVG